MRAQLDARKPTCITERGNKRAARAPGSRLEAEVWSFEGERIEG